MQTVPVDHIQALHDLSRVRLSSGEIPDGMHLVLVDRTQDQEEQLQTRWSYAQAADGLRTMVLNHT